MSQPGQAPSAEELLAHGEWLTRIARALVGDAAADDIVQETYEVALAQPPKREGPIGPWLGGVARNLARMAARGRGRRARREEQIAVEDELPSPEQLVARAELQQAVGRLVLELDEPLRSTLLLRFFEGMSAADIARKQGIPAATVRSRLKDALDRIRASLDANHSGRRAWLALLAPLPAGGLLVKKIMIAVVLAILVVAGTRVAGLWGRANPSSPPLPVVAASPPPAAHASAASALAMRTIHDADPKGALRLEGQVIDEHDQPVAHALVAIDTNPPTTVETDAGGAFVFDGLLRRDYWIEATAGDRYAGPVRLRLGDKPEPVTLRTRAGGTVEVAVTNRSGGAPIAGAEVELRSTLTWTATTGADGIARLTGVGAIRAPLAVRAAGLAPAAVMIKTSGDANTPDRVAVSLARGAALSGRVVDEHGAPIAKARVTAMSTADAWPVVDPQRDGVVAGADGTFAIESLSAGTWRLTAAGGDFAPTTSVPITVDGEHEHTGVELVLAPGGAVHGTVRDAAGAPVAGADVSVVVRGFVPWRTRRQAVTDDAGAFTIGGLARRSYDVVAWHETAASQIVPVELAAASARDVTLVLDITGAITGTVVDTRGQPLGDAQVVASPVQGDRAAWDVRGVQETVTDQGGAFRFAGLPGGSYVVSAARPGASEAALQLSPGITTEPGGGPIQIVVPAEGRAVGKVRLVDGSAPIAFTITLGGTTPVGFTAKDGSFAMRAPFGTYPLTISGPGFMTASEPVTIDEAKDTDLGTIVVSPGRSISGRVVDEHGAPVAKAAVVAGALLTGGGTDLYIKDESIATKDTQTDDTGRFVLDGFPPMALTVIAGKTGVGRSASVRLPSGPDSATLDLVLAPTTRLEGTITSKGAPLPDTVVIANPVGAIAQNFFVTTGPDGGFVIDALAPGTYVVSPMIGGGGPGPKNIYLRRVELVAGATARVDIDATAGPITLSLSVKTDAGAPLPNAAISAIAAPLEPHTVEDMRDGTLLPVTDQVIPMYLRGERDGVGSIDDMRPGLHTICVVLGDMRMPTASTKFQCTQKTLSAATAQSIAIVVPASWLP
ncbi:MAG TPA: sigma-70 family RNA polymerase sigma factor [Kofleriaceae bacterium]|jgi:RNA polymerase sigma factor (sigma-70 family)